MLYLFPFWNHEPWSLKCIFCFSLGLFLESTVSGRNFYHSLLPVGASFLVGSSSFPLSWVNDPYSCGFKEFSCPLCKSHPIWEFQFWMFMKGKRDVGSYWQDLLCSGEPSFVGYLEDERCSDCLLDSQICWASNGQQFALFYNQGDVRLYEVYL